MLHDTDNYVNLDVTYPGPRSRMVDKIITGAAGGEQTGSESGQDGRTLSMSFATMEATRDAIKRIAGRLPHADLKFVSFEHKDGERVRMHRHGGFGAN